MKCVSCVTSSPLEATQRDGLRVSPIHSTDLPCARLGMAVDGQKRSHEGLYVCVFLESRYFSSGGGSGGSWVIRQTSWPLSFFFFTKYGRLLWLGPGGSEGAGSTAVSKPRLLGGRRVLQSLSFTVETLSSPCAQVHREAAEVLKREREQARNPKTWFVFLKQTKKGAKALNSAWEIGKAS